MIRAAAAIAAALAVVAAGVVALDQRPTVVAAGAPVVVQRGGVVELAPGRHEAFTVDVPATIRAHPGAVVDGGVEVRADGVTLDGVRVEGGETGILVRGARDVVLDGVTVRGAELHGIEIVQSVATIRGCTVEGLRSRYAQGIEVRNSAGMGHSVIEGCRVTGGQEGLVAHVSRVQIRGNEVTATTQRGITVTEMSEGLVEGNTVRDVAGTGIFCGDMSHCEVRANTIDGVVAGRAGVRSEAGHAVAALYYATVRAYGNPVAGLAGEPIYVGVGSITTERFPLSIWPAGWRGALAVVPMTVAWAAVLGAAWLLTARGSRRWAARPARAHSGPMVVLGATAAVQAFHQFEHTLQVWQVMVADAERRAGLLGAAVDSEWLHFGFNIVLFVALLFALSEVRRALPQRQRARAGHWLIAGLAVQSYHLAEHVVKLGQHVTLRIDPAPGIIGHRFGLVAFHFAINTAVSVAVLAGAGIALRTPVRARRVRPAGVPAPA